MIALVKCNRVKNVLSILRGSAAEYIYDSGNWADPGHDSAEAGYYYDL